MFLPSRGTGFWSEPGVHWRVEAIGDQVDKALEGPEWAREGTSDQVRSCYQWSLWYMLTATIKSPWEKDSVMRCWDLPNTRDRWLQSPLLSEHAHLPARGSATFQHLGLAIFSSQGHHIWHPKVPQGIRYGPHKASHIPHRASSLKAQTCPVSLLRET